MFTKMINGLHFNGTAMLVQCQHTLLPTALENDDLSETGKYLRVDLSPGHPLGDVRSAIFRDLRAMTYPPKAVVIPFYPGATDNLGPITGTFAKRLVTHPAWRTHLPSGPTVISNPNSIYLPTWDDWILDLSVRIHGDVQVSTDDLLALLTATGLHGIGLTVDGATTGTFTVDSSGMEVVEE